MYLRYTHTLILVRKDEETIFASNVFQIGTNSTFFILAGRSILDGNVKIFEG